MPEAGMLNVILLFPRPALVSPQCTVLVTTGLHESEKVGIPYVVAFNGERRHVDYVFAAFIVPAEKFAATIIHAEGRLAFRNFNEVRFYGFAARMRMLRVAKFTIVRNPMEQVREGFRVHKPVLYGSFQHFEKLRMTFARMLHCRFDCRIQ